MELLNNFSNHSKSNHSFTFLHNDAAHPIAKEPNSCTPIPELWNEQKWVTWCKTNCGNPAGSHPACNGTGAHVKCTCGYSACNTFNYF